ncbi:MAG TPA: hypothetical protein VMI92_13685 [Steroidobacteraceae bacterium]|nr:hypothetical protein [Steroidobacteraceae bacterium]
MNSLFGCFRVVAAALCGVALVACNAVRSVDSEPTIANPAQKVVLGGKITGLGTRRPLVLQNNGQDSCVQPKDPNNPSGDQIVGECSFFGVLNQPTSDFSFGALPVGSTYNLTVKRQPFAKICTIANGSGTLGATGPATPIQISCTDDPAVTHYSVTVGIAAAASSLPGLKLTLTTENGSWDVAATGLTSYTFADTPGNPGYVFNSGSSPPVMGFRVTATIPGATPTDPVINCFVNNNDTTTPRLLVTNTGGNIDDSTTPPAAAIAPSRNVDSTYGIQVVSCGFQVRAAAEYSARTGETAPTIASGDGVTLLLRKQPSEVDVATVKLTSLNGALTPFLALDAAGNATTTPYQATSDANAFYEVVVKSSPAGMACIPGYSTTGGNAPVVTATPALPAIGKVTDAGAVLLIKPASTEVAGSWIVDRVVRCRTVPAASGQLRGVYQQTGTTTTTTTITTTAPATTVAASTAVNRNFLALFEDGTYLFGAHASSVLSSGVEQGFYVYDPAAHSIVFTALTDTSGSGGMNNAGAAETMSNVVKSAGGSPGTITGHYSNSTTTGLVLGSGALTVAYNGGTATNVTAATYATAAALAAAINTAATAAGAGSTAIAVATSANEIQITAPAGGGVVVAGSLAAGLGLGTVAAGATAVSTGVANATKTVRTDMDWTLTEVGPDTTDHTATLLDGGWVTWDVNRLTEDRRRVFIYQHGKYQAVHIGVNGIGNMQDACYVSDIGESGTWVRQGARSGCSLPVVTTKSDGSAPTSSGLASLDVPNPTTSPALTPGFQGKWPQSTDPTYSDGRPYSPVDFEVRPAGTVANDPVCPNSDKLTVWDTKNGVRLDQLTPPIPPIVLCRVTAN